MIVTCEECSTSFELDESRIPATGARVRCSRCKHAFFLPNPNATDSQAVHSIAEDAAADAAPVVPPAADDLDAGAASAAADVNAASAASVASEVSAAPVSPAPPEAEPDEEEWQFSEEVRTAGDEDGEEAALGAGIPDDSDFGSQGEIGGGFDPNDLSREIDANDLEMPSTMAPPVDEVAVGDDGSASGLELDGPAAPPPPPAPARDESSFGTVDDFSSLMEDEAPSPDPTHAMASAAADVGASSAPPGTYSEKGATDDLGEPESWDLVGGDDADPAQSSVAGVARSFSNSLGDAGSYAESLFGQDSDAIAFPEDTGEASKLLGLLAAASKGVGWLATCAAVASLLWLGLTAEWNRWQQTPQVQSVGPITAETESAGWVETSRAGFLLLVSGHVRNTGSAPILPGAVELALLDGTGARLTTPAFRAGAMLPARLLRESSPEQLEANIQRAEQRFVGSPMAPGEVRAFQAILPETRLPEQARRLLLELGHASAVAEPELPPAGAGEPAQLEDVSLPSP